jgi:hypothetical protein
MSQILDCINGGKKRRRGRMRLTLVTVSAIYAAMMFIIIGSAESLKYVTLSAHTQSPPLPVTSCLPCLCVCKEADGYVLPRSLAISQNMLAHHLVGMHVNCDLISRDVDAKSQYAQGT